MILHGNSRGNPSDLAQHLLRTDENDHVQVHEVSGFMADNLHGAFHEAEALSRGTRCEKFLFSLSISPPGGANISSEDFVRAADKAEKALGLGGQARVLVFHEKGENRDRHAHVVWSRIDVEKMKAIPMPFNRKRLREVSRELFIEHGLDVPHGLIDPAERSPLNYSLEEYQRAKRIGKDAQSIKAQLQGAWALSDNAASLSAALQERGYRLARGDRRGFVAVDMQGEVFSLGRWVGVKSKDVRERLGRDTQLPSVDETRNHIASQMTGKIDSWQSELQAREKEQKAALARQRSELVERQRNERARVLAEMKHRQEQEALERQSRFRRGLGGIWDFLRGETARIKARNEQEALAALQRDREQRDRIIHDQMEQRQQWRTRADRVSARSEDQRQALDDDREKFAEMREAFRAQERESDMRSESLDLER